MMGTCESCDRPCPVTEQYCGRCDIELVETGAGSEVGADSLARLSARGNQPSLGGMTDRGFTTHG